jgi:hypothetical protein
MKCRCRECGRIVEIPIKELRAAERLQTDGEDKIVLTPLACPNCTVPQSEHGWANAEVPEN